ncbi:GIY-YIG nuclease family protein [Pseudomonas viridiflava]|uniref:GIY-YIG nuclease family protein n=1 Tax=Pseudomonas viridiflava TaxID=33069 RepID=UPI000F013DE3|nr:GIY-YIG nuclease family protein [Pseudomonas viridiflava]MBV1810079.1 GIY-YIG nuclease family protein [Pseudomonas viridiflava]
MKFYRFDPLKLVAPVRHDTQVDSDLADLILRVRPKDCIVLAGWDAGAWVGRVNALGIVIAVDRELGRAKILWREVDITFRPNPSGRRYWVQAKHWFAFAPDVVNRYGLPDLHAEHFPDIAGFDIPAPPPPPVRSASRPSNSPTGGYVYVIRSKLGFKIGKTIHLKARTRLFEVKLPFPISLEHYAWFNDYTHAERSFHITYQAKRLEGEWFDLDTSDLQQIKMLGKSVPVAGL